MNDLISRQAAIDDIETVNPSMLLDVKWVKNWIKTLPSVQPEQKKGKWIEEVGMLMCSECGDAWGTEQFDEVMSFNFCPNCGAKMEKE